MAAFTSTFRVQFADTDMAGIMHFANFFRYMEEAEHAFFRSLGLSVHMEDAGTLISWPRVHAECDYKSPLRFEDEFEVRVTIREKRSKALILDFRFVKKADGAEVAAGSITAVCVEVDRAAGAMKAIAIPTSFVARIEAASESRP